MSEERTPEKEASSSDEAAAPAPPPPPRRGPGHRGQDVRDTMAEMAAKAHEISLEAGSKMAGTMREVIGAAAGLTAFAIESARDLVQYMVRRGQMTSDEADKLMREVEVAHANRVQHAPPPAPPAPLAKVEATPKKAPAVASSAPAEEPQAAAKPAAKPAPVEKAEVAPKSEPSKSEPSKSEPSKSEPSKSAKKAAAPPPAAAKRAAPAPPAKPAKVAAKAPAKGAAKGAAKKVATKRK